MNNETTSTINTALQMTRNEMLTTLAAVELARKLAPATEGYKYSRLAGKLAAHRLPAPGEVVRVQMNLRRLQFVRRVLGYALEVAIACGDAAFATVCATEEARVNALCVRRAAEVA